MNAVAAIAPFPANIVSSTYAVDYGRILGAEWMERSTGWHAPEVIVAIEIHSGDEDDIAVRVAITDQDESAIDRAWAWAEKEGIAITGAWIAGTRAEVEDSWGSQAALLLV